MPILPADRPDAAARDGEPARRVPADGDLDHTTRFQLHGLGFTSIDCVRIMGICMGFALVLAAWTWVKLNRLRVLVDAQQRPAGAVADGVSASAGAANRSSAVGPDAGAQRASRGLAADC
jgi:hypothetical protein